MLYYIMKKKIFVNLFCLTMLCCTSCSNDLKDTLSNDTKNEDIEFDNLCSSLDKLGNTNNSKLYWTISEDALAE